MACAACGIAPPLPPVPAPVATFFAQEMMGPAGDPEEAKPKLDPLAAASVSAVLPAAGIEQTGGGGGAATPSHKEALRPLPSLSTEGMFAADTVDVFGNPLAPPSESSGGGGGSAAALKVAAVYAQSVGAYTMPPVASIEDAVNATIHAMAQQFLEGRHMRLLIQLLNSRRDAPLPVHTARDPSTGASADIFLFDGAFLRALLQLCANGMVKPNKYDGNQGALREVVLFTCFAISIRSLFTRLTQAYYEVDIAARQTGKVGDLAKLLPSVYEFDPNERAKSELTRWMIASAQGIWRWSDDPDVFARMKPFADEFQKAGAPFAAAGASAATPEVGAKTGAYVCAPVTSGKADDLKVLYDAIATVDAAKSMDADTTIMQAFAAAAYRADTITALYKHFMWVAQAYTQFSESAKRRAADGPATADANFALSGGTGPSAVDTVCDGGNSVPRLVVSDANMFKQATGIVKSDNAPVTLTDGVIARTGQLMPGVRVEGCLPTRALADVVGGARMPASGGIAGMLTSQGTPLAMPNPAPIYANVRGMRLGGFGADETQQSPQPTTQAQTFAADTVAGIAAASPLVQQYFAAFHAPPSFRAVVITPPTQQ